MNTATWPCVRQSGDRVVLDLSVVPGAKRTELVGLHDGALRVRLAAPPVDGKANDALLGWLADELDVPRRELALIRGASSRRKQVVVNKPLDQVLAWLTARVPAA
ncbi:DUF167 domain-containing protein [Piscinibacter sp.]|uniref:DUF167 domain-containing protein n=1 Tax=Piscinibacter sp. TaxID=1903157 RepID=UPI002BA59330|nr:DUF167 domain-containing protein [Albitalea sp.]HUG24609.1 DUF167 domain-containing protein [Albitalea sp.]